MAISIKAYANADDVLIAWEPDNWPAGLVGFQLERKDQKTGTASLINNRIPPKPGQAAVAAGGISSALSPIRRCIWTDHGVTATDQLCYRVTGMNDDGQGGFVPDAGSASAWTKPTLVTGDMGDGLQAYFNRGTLMSQVVSRFVKGDVSVDSLRAFVKELADPGFAARRYLAGDARSQMLEFLADADRRGSSIYAAIYEINDKELVQGLTPFGDRGHILIGNGSATQDWVAPTLDQAGFEVKHRDLSHHGRSSPSVHNKFVVEVTSDGQPVRVLTGSTNWTVTGLCTQLNNVLLLQRPVIAKHYRDQWDALVAAGDDMTADLKASNAQATSDDDIELFFAATKDGPEMDAVKTLIEGAKQGVLSLMFMPGNSPLLEAILKQAQGDQLYVRGVVSSVRATGDDIVRVGSQVIKSGEDPKSFHRNVEVPEGVPADNKPSWAEAEFPVQEFMAAGLIAIVHSKVIVIDPFSPDCIVVTGSHNFSESASEKNDENLVIIKGNQKLAQAYAVHINGVYDGYSWRAFLEEGGHPDDIYKPITDWQLGGSRHAELAFWMNVAPALAG